MVFRFHENLIAKGVVVYTGEGVKRITEESKQGMTVETETGARLECGMALIATGVRPEISLAIQAGLEIGELGGIRVNERMQTSDEAVWAVGDVVEVKNFITGEWSLFPLAGPASRQGRIAAGQHLWTGGQIQRCTGHDSLPGTGNDCRSHRCQ